MIMPLSETGAFAPLAILLAAPLIGFAFGWFLERGGLGHAPKLAGQFFLADLTVLKVMLTAVITAMLGAFWLDQVGLLDLQRVHLPETFLLPQAAGGALFGAGFLIAGLCPGTSCVAAAAGRLDGLAAAGGMLAGIFVFNGLFGWIEGFYQSTPLGQLTFADLAGVSRGTAVAAATLILVAAVAVAARIERARQ